VLAGFERAVKEMGLATDPKLIETTASRSLDMDIVGMFDRLLQRESPPTAIFLAEPQFGSVALFVARHSDREALRTMTFVAYEIEEFSSIDQSMDVVESPLSDVGRAGVALLREVAEEKSALARRILITPRLRSRQE